MDSPIQSLEYFPIEIQEFVFNKQLSLELYLRVDDRFIKILNAGEELEAERLEKYRKKNAQYVYLTRADYEKYIGFHLKLVTAAARSAAVPDEKRMQLLRHANEVVLQQIYIDGVDQKAFDYAKTISNINLAVLVQRDDVFSAIEAMTKQGDFLLSHAMAVSIFATMMGPKLECHSAAVLSKLSLGGLLHDIGMKDLPREMLSRAYDDYTDEEKAVFQRHPLAGLEMLQGLEGVPQEVLMIVAQHHEYRDASGYPGHMAGTQIFPLSKIVGVADMFCEITLNYPGSKHLDTAGAIQWLNDAHGTHVDPKVFEALMAVVGVSKF